MTQEINDNLQTVKSMIPVKIGKRSKRGVFDLVVQIARSMLAVAHWCGKHGQVAG